MCLTNRQSNFSQARHCKAKRLTSQRKLRRHPTAGGDPVASFEVLPPQAHMVGYPCHGDERMPHHIAAMTFANGLVVDEGAGLGLPQRVKVFGCNGGTQHNPMVPSVFSHQTEKAFF